MGAGGPGAPAAGRHVNATLARWAPAALLGVGALSLAAIRTQRPQELRRPLAAAIPRDIGGYAARDVTMAPEEVRAAGVTAYLDRVYSAPEAAAPLAAAQPSAFSLYVGYYDRQDEGHSIHSPRNCLPGAGWDVVSAGTALVAADAGTWVPVNRYIVQRNGRQALVLYWYQGRGRVAASEYRVKWDLLRDAILRRRSEEALIRVVVPVTSTVDAAAGVATRVAGDLMPALASTLPS